MRTRARSPRIPRKLLRGQKLLDGITGEEIYQRDPTTMFQRGMWVHKKNFDYLTTEQMEEMLLDTLGLDGISMQGGQGKETPSYSNLPTYANDAAAIKAGYVYGMPYLDPSGVLSFVGIASTKHNITDASGNVVKDSSGNIVQG